MCPAGNSTQSGPLRQDARSKTIKLNPGANEYRADLSTSESSSPGCSSAADVRTPPQEMDPAPRRQQGSSDFIISSETAASMARSSNGTFRQDHRSGGAQKRQHFGWESPQAMAYSSAPPVMEFMMPPTRQLSIPIGRDEDEGMLLQQLKRHGEVRSFDPSPRASEGVVLATFYNLRDAIATHDALSLPTPPPPGNPGGPMLPPRAVRFVPLDCATRSDAEAGAAAAGILAVEVTEGDVSREDLGRACSVIGEVSGIWDSGGLYFVEFIDTRDAERALSQLYKEAPEGCQLAVRHADLDPIILLGRTSSVAQVAAGMRGGMPGPPSRASSFGRSASPPPILPPGSPQPMVMPVMPAYSWGAAYPVFQMYPPEAGPMERAASPPAVFPNGGSPPLPSGFISIPVRSSGGPMYGGSPPFGPAAFYGSSPPGLGSSPPAVMFMAPPPAVYDASGNPMVGQFMPAGPELMQHMAGLSLGAQQAQQQGGQQQQDKPQRSDSRASARIARSHRAGGAYNPLEFEFSVEEAESGRPDARATIMIRNIPNKYTQAVMLDVLDKSGFKGQFDFFYLPIDFRNRCNLGYAFINFTTPGAAARLYKQYHNKRWEEFNSKKVCEVSYARVQGRDPLIEHFRASKFPSDDVEYMPLVYTQLDNGMASDPVPIHKYLARQVESASANPGAGGMGAENVTSESTEE